MYTPKRFRMYTSPDTIGDTIGDDKSYGLQIGEEQHWAAAGLLETKLTLSLTRPFWSAHNGVAHN